MNKPKFTLGQLVSYDGNDYRVREIYALSTDKVVKDNTGYIYALERDDMKEFFNIAFEFEVEVL